jgi:CDP-paratose 2-epimerase
VNTAESSKSSYNEEVGEMAVAVITGSAGLIGAEAARFFADKGLDTVGIDNDMRREFFGEGASTAWNRQRLESELKAYRHYDIDIRDQSAVADLFERYGTNVAAVIHAFAQPSHDWAAKAPFVDFSINASGTLNLLKATRQSCPDACFIFTSTNKVYGDTPNRLPLVEQPTRLGVAGRPSVWAAWDRRVHEYRPDDAQPVRCVQGRRRCPCPGIWPLFRYFGMKTACFRGGCLTGPDHSGTQLHGFLAYLVKCALTNTPCVVFGHQGKQVRDNIHSFDLVNAFWHFFEAPRSGGVYNIGSGRHSNCSMLEAIEKCQSRTGREMRWSYSEANRAGDHIWWISDIRRFQTHYPGWSMRYDLDGILAEIFEAVSDRALRSRVA